MNIQLEGSDFKPLKDGPLGPLYKYGVALST